MEAEKLAALRSALRRSAPWLVRIIAALLWLGFVLASPGVTDRRQVLVVLGTMCASLLGLMMAVVTLVFRIHYETLRSELDREPESHEGIRSFWRTMFSVVIAL